MIARYSRAEMAKIWTEQSRFQKWFEVELAVLKVLEQEKRVPPGVAAKIRAKARIRPERIAELEDTLKHDVIAFTTSIAEQSGEIGRFFHFGLTSSDVVDTALSMQIQEAVGILRKDLEKLDQVLVRLAKKYKSLPAIGRTHGVHAEPMSFGLKFLGWLTELRRQRARLDQAGERMRVGKLSGAVGCYGVLSPKIERKALEILGLKPELVATQVIPRDRHAEFFSTLAGVAATVERVCVELRHLQRTEVREVEEEFSAGQKGSSAMPHKKNPISAENLSGCARLMRGYAASALENVALWHERDISHSSVERVIGPDATILLDYMLGRLAGILERLQVREENVARNLALTKGIYFSGQFLLRFVEKGISREEAYRVVQKAAHTAWEKGADFQTELWKEPSVQSVFTQSELKKAFEIKNYLKHIDEIYERVLRDDSKKKKK